MDISKTPNKDKPRPLPTWLRLRMAASTLMSPSHRRGAGNVIVLPFNTRVVKLDVRPNEIAAMEFVRANTTIPIPKVLEIHDRQPDGTAHIVMSHIPGRDLEQVMVDMSSEQVAGVVKELAGYLSQLRQLGKDVVNGEKRDSIIGGVGGIPGHDIRLGLNRPWGPFQTITEFHRYLRFNEPLQHWTNDDVKAVHSKPEGHYKIRFTHADIAPRNIRVGKDGKIAGIIDWEFAGWYPEYWEYVKMAYAGALQRPGWKMWSDAIEAEEGITKYKDELKADEAIQLRAGPFPYDNMP
ncbi:Protein kinase-like domain containing protein [Rhypophila sp. PSN 637]